MTWQFWKKKNKENIDLFEYGRPHLVMSTQLILDDTDIHYMELPENAIPVFKLANKYFYEGRNSLLNFGSHYEGWEEESIKSYMNAIENYQKILNLIGGSSHPAVYIFYNIGTTYLYCGSQILIKNLEKNTNSQEFVPELSESVKYLERTLDLKNRQYFLASFNLGVAYYLMGKFERAISAFDEAIECVKDVSFEYQKALHVYRLWEYRGEAFVDLQRYREAIESYQKTLQWVPDDEYVIQVIKYAKNQEKNSR